MQNILQLFKHSNKKWFALFFDILMIPLAWYCAYCLRYSTINFSSQISSMYNNTYALIILFIIQFTCYLCFKVYRGVWYYASINDLLRILKSSVLAIVVAIPIFYFASLLNFIPRSILPLYAICLNIFLCSGRLITRAYYENHSYDNELHKSYRVLIIGAGQAGEGLVRDLKRFNNYNIVGLIDDNLSKSGMDIHGICVLGMVKDIPNIVPTYKIDLIFIAIPSAKSAAMRHIVKYCELSNVAFRTLPCVASLLSNQVAMNALRNVNIDDLLGREQVKLSWDKICNVIADKRILVTGGGGSIGSELCRQILILKPHSLLIVDNSEFNLYKIEQELKDKYPHINLAIKLVSTIDIVGINLIFEQFKPHIVFHAAAYKHVPMLETQLRVAIENNIFGTKIIAEASINIQAEKFILISSDKAVNPVNVMGVTKRVAEIFCQNINSRVNTQFITVRFGNVLGSAGSVVPLFQKQIQENQNITVTHPDIQRYFMTVIEACQLILQATVDGNGGEIFVLNMGEPIKINYLAEQMIKLSGKELNKDITITYTGLRPGEKLFEELFHESEKMLQTQHEKLFIAGTRLFNWQELITTLNLLQKECSQNNEKEIYILLQNLVPEYCKCVGNILNNQPKVTLYEDGTV